MAHDLDWAGKGAFDKHNLILNISLLNYSLLGLCMGICDFAHVLSPIINDTYDSCLFTVKLILGESRYALHITFFGLLYLVWYICN